VVTQAERYSEGLPDLVPAPARPLPFLYQPTPPWRQVLEYFDAYLIGLTATPSKQTFGFFQQNVVMEYNREQAVADGVSAPWAGSRSVGRIMTLAWPARAFALGRSRDRGAHVPEPLTRS
jgi:hypothetical protein